MKEKCANLKETCIREHAMCEEKSKRGLVYDAFSTCENKLIKERSKE